MSVFENFKDLESAGFRIGDAHYFSEDLRVERYNECLIPNAVFIDEVNYFFSSEFLVVLLKLLMFN